MKRYHELSAVRSSSNSDGSFVITNNLPDDSTPYTSYCEVRALYSVALYSVQYSKNQSLKFKLLNDAF